MRIWTVKIVKISRIEKEMIEGRAQFSDVSKLGLRDLKVTIFHPFCRAEDKENQDRSVPQLDQSSKTRQKNQDLTEVNMFPEVKKI